MSKVNISGLDRAELLAYVWNYAGSFASISGNPAGFDEMMGVKKSATEALAHSKSIDYFNGRPIKVDFSKDMVDPWLFDRDAGEGAFSRAVTNYKLWKASFKI